MSDKYILVYKLYEKLNSNILASIVVFYNVDNLPQLYDSSLLIYKALIMTEQVTSEMKERHAIYALGASKLCLWATAKT